MSGGPKMTEQDRDRFAQEIEHACARGIGFNVRRNGWRGTLDACRKKGIINLPNEADGNLPAHYLVQKVYDLEMLSLADEAGMDFNMPNRHGEHPIHFAAFRPDDASETATVIGWLVRRARADVNVPTSPEAGGCTPLHLAALRRDLRRVRELLNAGADLEAATPAGWTPLHLAAFGSSPEMVLHLIGEGASPAAKTGDGLTPADLARMHNGPVRGDAGAMERLNTRVQRTCRLRRYHRR